MARRIWLILLITWVVVGCAILPPIRSGYDDGEGPEHRRRAMRYFVQAKVFESQHKYEAAVVALRNVADLEAQSATIYGRLAVNYSELQDYFMAAVFARKALALDSSFVEMHHLLLQIAYLAGDRNAAIAELEELLSWEPLKWKFYFQLARLYMEVGDQTRITPLFDKALEHPQAPASLRVDIADIFAQTGQENRARMVYEQVRRSTPDNEDAWHGLAELHRREGDDIAAAAIYRDAGRQLPDAMSIFQGLATLVDGVAELQEIYEAEAPAFLYRLGVALSELDKNELAAMVFRRIVRVGPDTAVGWIDLATHYFYREQFDRADSVFAQAVVCMPDSSDIYLHWGVALEEQDREDEAQEVYRRGLASMPTETELYTYLGLLLERRNEFDQARALYRKGLAVGAEPGLLHMRLGIVLGRERLWYRALEHYELAVAADAGAPVHLHWGIALTRLERWDEAASRLEIAVSHSNDRSQALFYLGSCLEQASRATGDQDFFDRSVKVFLDLIELNPHDAYALNYLGYMYADKGIQLQEAVRLLRRAVDLDPANGAFLDSLGWAYFRLGDLSVAARFVNEALRQVDEGEPAEVSVILDHAGDIAQHMGNFDEAQHHWRGALELDPDNRDIQIKLDAAEGETN